MDLQWLAQLSTRFEDTTGIAVRGLVSALVLLLVVLAVYKVLERGLHYLGEHREISPTLRLAARRGLRWLAALVALLTVLQAIGLLEDAWAAFTAIAAMFAIGFVAVWSVLSNTLCSLILLVSGPFHVGDTIEIAPEGMKGKVVNFTLLFTTLKVVDGETIQVPNNLFFQRVIRRQRGNASVKLDEQLLKDEDALV